MAKIDLKTKIVTFKYLVVRIASKGATFIIVVVYRLGSVRPDKNFSSEFTKFLGAAAAFSTPVTIVGDINIRLYRPDDGDTVTLLYVISSYELSQFVTEQTRHLGGLLDVITTSNSNAPQDLCVTEVGISDHLLLS